MWKSWDTRAGETGRGHKIADPVHPHIPGLPHEATQGRGRQPFRAATVATGVRAAVALLALVALAPAAVASGPHLTVVIHQADDLVGMGETLDFTLAFTFTCGEPADPTTHVDVEPPSGNYFNITLAQEHWVFSGGDCAQAHGTIRRETAGTFHFVFALPPFHTLKFPMAAFVGDGDTVWTSAGADLNATPDAQLLMGAVLAQPTAAARSGSDLTETASWTVTNHGKGRFHAEVRVDSKPDWLQVEVPAEVDSGPDMEGGARANLTMQATMPVACPAPVAVVTLALDVRSPEPRSRAAESVKVQGKLPCQPGLAKGTPGLPAALFVAALAMAAARRRGPGRTVRQHKR